MIVHIVADAYLTDWTSFSAFIVLFKILQESDHTWIGNVYRSLTLYETNGSILMATGLHSLTI